MRFEEAYEGWRDRRLTQEEAGRLLGMGKHAGELILTLNRAAEAAMPEAKALLVDSVRKMSGRRKR